MVKLIRFTLALILILSLSPILIIVCIGIYVSDPGSVFFKTSRVGKDGEIFTIYKFRSMKNSKAGSKITSKNDERIFGFGKFIRKTKLDELPQLLNILKGDMAFIGPRPEDVEIVENYYDDFLRKTLEVKPGLASPGSLFNYTHLESLINGENAEEIYIEKILKIKVGIDVVYAKRKSIFYDLRICFKTILIIVQMIFGKENFNYPKEYFELKKLHDMSL